MRKRKITATLSSWDLLSILLILVLVGILFQQLVYPLMIDSAREELISRHREISEEYETSLEYLTIKGEIPFQQGLDIIFTGISRNAQTSLDTDEGRVYFGSPSELPDPYASFSTTEVIQIVRFNQNNIDFIGTHSILGSSKDSPILVILEDERTYFYRIFRIRLIFWSSLTIIMMLIFIIRTMVTRQIKNELALIGMEMEEHGRALIQEGNIKRGLDIPELSFRETEDLFDRYSNLNEGLNRVGEVLGGIADPELFTALLRNDRSLLDPHLTDMTIMFIDVEGFTTLSEKYGDESMTIINTLWDSVEEAVMPRGGKINKFIGDACLVIFPEVEERSIEKAFDAAINIVRSAQKLRKKLKIDFAFRVGLDRGRVTYGKTGSMNNYELGVIGDAVNTSSRLEGLNKQYGTKFLISHRIIEKLPMGPDKSFQNRQGEKFRLFKVDFVRPKGKKVPLALYTVLIKNKETWAIIGNESPIAWSVYNDFLNLQQQFEEGISLWTDNSGKASCLWRELLKDFSSLVVEKHFLPALPHILSLLDGIEKNRFEKDRSAWYMEKRFNPVPPDKEWCELGAREMGK